MSAFMVMATVDGVEYEYVEIGNSSFTVILHLLRRIKTAPTYLKVSKV